MADINVAVVTQREGAHLREYFAALAETPEVARVAVADDSGESFGMARQILKDKFAGEYPDVSKLLAKTEPKMDVGADTEPHEPVTLEDAKEAVEETA